MVHYFHVFRVSGDRKFVASVQSQAVHAVVRDSKGKPLVAMSDQAFKKAIASNWW